MTETLKSEPAIRHDPFGHSRNFPRASTSIFLLLHASPGKVPSVVVALRGARIVSSVVSVVGAFDVIVEGDAADADALIELTSSTPGVLRVLPCHATPRVVAPEPEVTAGAL